MRTKAKKYDCYIASGWFNPAQAQDLENIKAACVKTKLNFFSPKDELLVKPDDAPEIRKKAFSLNLRAIRNSRFIIVNTRDKDMGTLVECGYAYARYKPIVFYCEGLTGKFNLMLAQMGSCVATNLEELKEHLENISKDLNYRKPYEASIE